MDRAACSSCGAPILWATSVTTKRALPLDPEPVPAGTRGAFAIVLGVVKSWAYGPRALSERIARQQGITVEDAAELVRETYPHHASHFATCPQAQAHRKAQP